MIEQAQWIKCKKDCEAPVIRKTFFLKAPLSGVIDITGLGFFELYLNGERVSDDYLVPALSDYQKRELAVLSYPISDTFSHRIYYMNYDISDLLKDGENVMEVALGNGWYRQTERTAEGQLSFGDELKAIFSAEIELASGEKVIASSDGTEVFYPSCITYSNLYIGEVHDARLNKSRKDFRRVEIESAPGAELYPSICPPDRVVRTVAPKYIKSIGKRKIFDAGENISGWVRVKMSGRAGDTVTLRFAEELAEDGSLDFASTGGGSVCASGRHQIQTDVFISDGTPSEFEPKFAYHGFRYFDIEGDFDDLLVAVVHSDVACTSEFESDSEALNWLYEAYIRTQLGNMHGGVPSDCPHRERLGYTGDGQITADSAMLLLDGEKFYEKWIYDILDCQDRDGGHIQHTAPFMGGGGGPGVWGGAVVIVPYMHYKHYGNIAVLKAGYPAMIKWISYMRAHSEDGIVVREEDGGWCLGEWASMQDVTIPAPYVNTCYFIRCLQLAEEVARILGTGEEESLRGYAALLKKAVIREFYDSETGSFCGGEQAADAYALYVGITSDRRTLENLVRKYDALGHFDTGFVGTDVLIEVLLEQGCCELAYKLLTTDEKGSYMWLKKNGATTLWEYFNGRASHNHPMFGAPVRHLFYSFLGIAQADGTCAFRRIRISPQIPAQMNYARGRIKTASGTMEVAWRKSKTHILFSMEIPENTEAEFCFDGETKPLKAGKNSLSFKK